MQYSVAVFDTAPTGHNFPFLSFPTVLAKALGTLSSLSSAGAQTDIDDGQSEEFARDMFASMRVVINEVNAQLEDPENATFVCGAVSHFLSLC
ncbi:hypothetical protein EDC04DRAFT_2715650 [Pisolithus marmoratus]|nr:hypothetical protein EDC04DRAFT_2715650 [Pisolithus marmoratus]